MTTPVETPEEVARRGRMSEETFDVFKGLMTGGFTFRGVDNGGGAWFEHTCGHVVRFGPGAPVSSIADESKRHECGEELPRKRILECDICGARPRRRRVTGGRGGR